MREWRGTESSRQQGKDKPFTRKKKRCMMMMMMMMVERSILAGALLCSQFRTYPFHRVQTSPDFRDTW